jgi:CSLREA domain-containing protein
MALAVGVVMLSAATAVRAAAFTVDTFADTNDGSCGASCSLRDAIVAADTAGGASTITLQAGSYKLSIASTGADDPRTGDLDVDNGASITINGAGEATTLIDANHVDRAFAVLPLSRQLFQSRPSSETRKSRVFCRAFALDTGV